VIRQLRGAVQRDLAKKMQSLRIIAGATV
jgi:hypothetical protein